MSCAVTSTYKKIGNLMRSVCVQAGLLGLVKLLINVLTAKTGLIMAHILFGTAFRFLQFVLVNIMHIRQR